MAVNRAAEDGAEDGLGLELLPESLALLRLPAGSEVPQWTSHARAFLSVTRTPAEISIVADAAAVPVTTAVARVYRAFRVVGPIPLHVVGVLAKLTTPLADAGVPIFTIATHDTDYLLVEESDVSLARRALERAGHRVAGSD